MADPDDDTPIDQVVDWLRQGFPREYRTLTAGGAIHAVLDEFAELRARVEQLEAGGAGPLTGTAAGPMSDRERAVYEQGWDDANQEDPTDA